MHRSLDLSMLYELMCESADFLKDRGIGVIDMACVLGSGLGAVTNRLTDLIEIPYHEIPHMPVSGAPGHQGSLLYGRLGATQVLMFSGRLHYYEGLPLWRATYPIRILQGLGVRRVLLTALVGGLTDKISPGDFVFVEDHLALMPDNPLRGISDARMGSRFPDLSGVYFERGLAWMSACAEQLGIRAHRGVYAALQGPSLETQAECRMLRMMGADVVGMSLVPEVIVCAQAGIEVMAACAVANMAWHPDRPEGHTVEQILAMAQAVAPQLAELVEAVCQRPPSHGH